MEKLFAVLALFRKGNAVADPALWKNGSITVLLLVPAILALNRVGEAFGVGLGISEDEAATIAAGIVSLVGVVSHVITSKTIGLPPVNPPDKTNGYADRTTDYTGG
jgi:hypothetical protein